MKNQSPTSRRRYINGFTVTGSKKHRDTHFRFAYSIDGSHLAIMSIAGAYRGFGYGSRGFREPAQLTAVHGGHYEGNLPIPYRVRSVGESRRRSTKHIGRAGVN